MSARPELLRSSQQVSMKDVLAHADMESFIRWAAEKKVSELTFAGTEELRGFIKDRLGLELVAEGSEHHMRLKQAIAARNLFVHNRGIIDQRFIQTVGNLFGKVGDRLPSDILEADRPNSTLHAVVESFDPVAAGKFSLELIEYKSLDEYRI
jgi:hypothetical protein